MEIGISTTSLGYFMGQVKQNLSITVPDTNIAPSMVFFLIFTGVQLLYNVVLVSAAQQSQSILCLFFRFPSHVGHHRALS